MSVYNMLALASDETVQLIPCPPGLEVIPVPVALKDTPMKARQSIYHLPFYTYATNLFSKIFYIPP